MRAHVVIGANFGDEGKGLVTDYLCSQGAGMVVRFNGGAQAGHTVVTPGGDRHVFGHFGSGSFVGVPTYLSQYFVCNPILFFREAKKLHELGYVPTVYAHPSCLITTHVDMIVNQRKETARGDKRHGSCGVGVHETIQRSAVVELKLTMADLWNHIGSLPALMERLCDRWAKFRTGSAIVEPAMTEAFIKTCWAFAEAVHPLGIQQCPDPIFEGAQGLLLDQDNKEYWPHVTHSSTGMKNVRVLCQQGGFDGIDPYYVSRTYLTRHGAGTLPGENPKMAFEDATNVEHPWQGTLRFAPLDYNAMAKRAAVDAYGPHKLVMTHCDQLDKEGGDLRWYGPTRDDVRETSKAVRMYA